MAFDPKRYTRDEAYRQIINDTLETISTNFQIPFGDLYTGLFYKRDSVNGILWVNSNVDEAQIIKLKQAFNAQMKGKR